jgi:hypothetical protein
MTPIATALAWSVRGLFAVFVCAFLFAVVGLLLGVGWLMSDSPEDH